MPKRKFTADEVREAVWENKVKTYQGEDRRWSRTNTTIVFMEDDKKHYSLRWEHGLTEQQENDFEAQEADEVEAVKITETIITQSWVNVE